MNNVGKIHNSRNPGNQEHTHKIIATLLLYLLTLCQEMRCALSYPTASEATCGAETRLVETTAQLPKTVN